jgi:hypothetical protein
VNEEVKVERIEINRSNVWDLQVPTEIAPAVIPKSLPASAGDYAQTIIP